MRWRIPVVVGIVGVAVSPVSISTPSVWYDEAATASAATRSLPQLFALLGNIDAVHGLYYLLMHVVFAAFGYSPFSLRIVSAVAIGIAAALVVVLDRQLRPSSRGILAGIVFCFLPCATWMGGEGRSFGLATAFAALLTVLLLHALAGRGWRRWVIYAVVVLIGCTLFLYLALLVVAHGVIVLFMRRRMLVPWALATALAAGALVPFLLLVMSESSQLPELPALGLETANDVLVGQWFGSSILLAVLAWLVIGIGLWRSRSVVLSALVIPTGILLIAAVHSPELYQPRYLSFCAPFVAVGIATGIAAFPARIPRVAAVVAIVALGVPAVIAERALHAKKDGTWSEVAAIVADARDGSDTAVVFGSLFPHHGATARAISIAYPDAFRGTTDVTLERPVAESDTNLWGTSRRLTQSVQRLDAVDVTLLVTTAKRGEGLDDDTIQAAGWMRQRDWHEGDITIVRYVRVP